MSKHNSQKEVGPEFPEIPARSTIASWQVSNFQSIRERVELSLAPLTVFSGPNSSGKSAVIKSILMVAQSLSSSAWEVPLVLNGKYTHLGNFDDILHHGCDPPEIELGFAIKQGMDAQITAKVTFERYSAPNQMGNALSYMRVRRSVVYWENSDEGRFELIYQPVDLEAGERKRANQIIQKQIDQGLFDYKIIYPKSIESLTQFEEVVSACLTNFLPGQVLTRVQSKIRDLALEIEYLASAVLAAKDEQASSASIDWKRELSDGARGIFKFVAQRIPMPEGDSEKDDYIRTVREISEWPDQLTIGQIKEVLGRRLKSGRLSRYQIDDLSRRLRGGLSDMQTLTKDHLQSRQETQLEARQFSAQHNQIIQQIRQLLGSQLLYLGPLRDDPKVIYAIPPLPNQREVGLKGEYTAAMLNIHHTLDIYYPLPPEPEERFNGRYSIRQGRLGEAVQIWLKRMGIAESFGTSITSKVGYRLSVRPEGINQDLDLTSLGVGVSQVLPTIVMALLAPADCVLIFEQPEVHLHPKVQSVLGDFFLGIVACGKQCIVETHSEHLINRIRRRIAESKDTKILQQIQIYFTQLENAVTQFRPVDANEYGAILEWPKGFFDEAEEESSAIIKASTEKRREARQKRLQHE